jgi:acyl carrier protein
MSKINSDYEIHFNILENALDFIESGVEFFGRNEYVNDLGKGLRVFFPSYSKPHDYKYALLNIASGLELLLKARLEIEHWSLIFDSVDKAIKDNLKTGNFSSVSFSNLILRLQNICGIKISEKQLKELKEFKNLRNKIEHYTFNINVYAIGPRLINILQFILHFIQDELEESGHLKYNDARVVSIKNNLSRISSFVDSRYKDIESKIESNKNIALCPICQQDTVIKSNNVTSCLFCLSKFDTEEFIDKYLNRFHFSVLYEHHSQGGFEVLTRCPACEQYTLIEEETRYKCLNCLEEYRLKEISRCIKCGETTDIVKANYICKDCVSG